MLEESEYENQAASPAKNKLGLMDISKLDIEQIKKIDPKVIRSYLEQQKNIIKKAQAKLQDCKEKYKNDKSKASQQK